eukprot:13595734-Ditylum_brightwellii.AAC.1
MQGAKFVRRGNMCEDKQAHGRGRQGVVLLDVSNAKENQDDAGNTRGGGDDDELDLDDILLLVAIAIVVICLSMVCPFYIWLYIVDDGIL